ncbi:sensor histidine kinase [Paenibacillus sp. strain BS8-2]
MIIILSIMVVVMAAIIVSQWLKAKKLNKNVRQMTDNLADIITQQTGQRVLVPTSHKESQQLLVQINRLLEHNQKVVADYTRSKDSQRKMISNMSHDLKTPLTVILGYTEQLNQTKRLPEEDEKQVIRRLYEKVNGVIALINQFFDLVKLEADDYVIPLSKISLSEVCRQSVLEFYDLLSSRNIGVELDIPDKPFYMLGNPAALDRVLSNLISNSIRYGNEGGVLGVTVREEGDFIAVDVWDRGKGIEEAHQSRVFDRLYTLDDARNRQFQGSGLGLSISKRLIEQMHGTIELSSVPNDKTTFTCRFKPFVY